jgi:hypothetical protein
MIFVKDVTKIFLFLFETFQLDTISMIGRRRGGGGRRSIVGSITSIPLIFILVVPFNYIFVGRRRNEVGIFIKLFVSVSSVVSVSIIFVG